MSRDREDSRLKYLDFETSLDSFINFDYITDLLARSFTLRISTVSEPRKTGKEK